MKIKLSLSNVQLLNFCEGLPLNNLLFPLSYSKITLSENFQDHPVEQQPVPPSTSHLSSLPAVCLLKKLFLCLAVPSLRCSMWISDL